MTRCKKGWGRSRDSRISLYGRPQTGRIGTAIGNLQTCDFPLSVYDSAGKESRLGSERSLQKGLCVTAFFLLPMFAVAAEPPASLDQGYRLMYNLQFDSAQREFLRWQREHSGSPLGPVSEAANLLFSEFERLGVLEAQFFVKDSSFTAPKKLLPDPRLRARFDGALSRAEAEARQRLAKDGHAPDSLFALAMVYGLKADYAALIEKRNMASLRYTRQASELADTLLAIAPHYYDAYLATGIGKYIVGSVRAPVRWILQIAGFDGDKERGIQELKLTAEKGRFLGPFARILLAIAYLRENGRQEARQLLIELYDEFPSNTLFAREVARIDGRNDSTPPSGGRSVLDETDYPD